MRRVRHNLRFPPRLFLLLLGSILLAPTVSAQEIKKTIERRFPAFFYCPIDPALTLTFTATGPQAILKFTTANFEGESWNAQVLDNIAIVEQSVFAAHQVVTPGYESCYVFPGSEDTPGYDFSAAATTEAFLDLFDTDAGGWDLGAYGYYNSFNGAPRDPPSGNDTGGGGLGMGNTDDGPVTVSVSRLISGLETGSTYVVTGWWYTQNLTPLEISVDFNVPKRLAISAAAFATRTTGTDFSNLDTGALGQAGSFIAPLALNDGAQVQQMSLVANVLDGFSSATARLMRVDSQVYSSANPFQVTAVTLSGNTQGVATATTLPTGATTIDTSRYFYYLQIDQSGSAYTYGVRLLYKDPPPPLTAVVASVAALPFDPEQSSIGSKGPDFGTLVSLGGTAPARFAAPVRLPQGGTISSLDLVARDNVTADATARLVRVPAGAVGGTVIATIATTGTDTAVRTFTTSAVSAPLVDNAGAYYYLEIETAAGPQIYGLRVNVATPGGVSSPVSDSLAGVPFLPSDTFNDLRDPQSEALAGTYYFNLGLQLPDNRQITGFRASLFDDDPDNDLRATLMRLDATASFAGPEVMGELFSSGASASQRLVALDQFRGHVVDNSRYFYYARLWMGFGPSRVNGVDVQLLPCGDADGDGLNGCAGDCDDTRAAVKPGGFEVCDGVINDCNSPAWPDRAGTTEGDDDGDGFSECQGDCADFDFTRWSPPGEVLNLNVSHDLQTGLTTLSWTPPTNPGGTAAPVYDTLRAFTPSAFDLPSGACAETDGADTTTTISGPAVPVGQCLHFLVRAEGACGIGTLGARGDGTPRTGLSCP